MKYISSSLQQHLFKVHFCASASFIGSYSIPIKLPEKDATCKTFRLYEEPVEAKAFLEQISLLTLHPDLSTQFFSVGWDSIRRDRIFNEVTISYFYLYSITFESVDALKSSFVLAMSRWLDT